MKKITEQWLKHAGDDLRSARILAEKQLYGMSCFHAQQAVKIAMKVFEQIKKQLAYTV